MTKRYPAPWLAAAAVLFTGLAARPLPASPPPDRSASHYAGEWIGTGPSGMLCQLQLTADGQGLLVVDPGTGDLWVADIGHRNENQSLRFVAVHPATANPQRRVLPLKSARIASEFNDSFELELPSSPRRRLACWMQRLGSFETRHATTRDLATALRRRQP